MKPPKASELMPSSLLLFPKSGGDQADPFGLISALRQRGSIHRVVLPRGDEAWVIADYQLMLSLLRDKRVDRNPLSGESAVPYAVLRRSMVAALPNELCRDISPFIRATSSRLWDVIKQKKSAELVGDISLPLSGLTLAKLFGVPPNECTEVLRFALAVPPLASHADKGIDRHEALRWLSRYFETRESSKEGVITRLNLIKKKKELTSREVGQVATMLFVAGHEPTANLISSSLLMLLSRPETIICENKSIVMTSRMVEELIRYDNPVFPGIFRFAHTSFRLAGAHIRRGDLLLLPIFAAGRGCCHFPNAETFDPRRKPVRSLAFGYGHHFCLGSRIAKSQLSCVIRDFLRLRAEKKITLDGEPVWARGPVRALTALPVKIS